MFKGEMSLIGELYFELKKRDKIELYTPNPVKKHVIKIIVN